MIKSPCTIGELDDAQDNWIWQQGGDSMQGTACRCISEFLCIALKVIHLVTLNEDSCNSKTLVMLSLVAEFSRGSSANPPSWKKSESRGYSMLSQWVFILEEVIYISETLWTLFPGINTQHIRDIIYGFRRFTGIF